MKDLLWGKRAKLSYLMIASVVLLFAVLGTREIWTQEHRWADVVAGMFYRQDFLHPYLGMSRYYDKPLLSYWLIVLAAKLWGSLTVWTLRLPSASAGLLAIWSIYRIGTGLKSKSLGFLAGWMLLTTYYFLFWARTSSADMLNLAGILFAIAWYIDKRERAGFFDFSIFFLILALTSLCKGLGGAIVPLLVVFVDVLMRRNWRHYLRLSLVLSVLPAAVIYALPFLASSLIGGESYGQSGLYMVYRENILRYFQPFDHQGPIYTYFIYLPVYLLPWTIFFIPALFALPKRWKVFSINSKWIAWSLLILFTFFTLSGSRRSYYVLPIVPFAILLTADWLLSLKESSAWLRWAPRIVGIAFMALFLAVDVGPAWYYSQYGVERFAMAVKKDASLLKPWQDWDVVMLDAETKLSFYLQLPPMARQYGIEGVRGSQTSATLLKYWPMIKSHSANTIFISRQLYAPFLKSQLPNYRIVETPSRSQENAPIAFIPVLAG